MQSCGEGDNERFPSFELKHTKAQKAPYRNFSRKFLRLDKVHSFHLRFAASFFESKMRHRFAGRLILLGAIASNVERVAGQAPAHFARSPRFPRPHPVCKFDVNRRAFAVERARKAARFISSPARVRHESARKANVADLGDVFDLAVDRD